jgi:hypothetical protein
MLYSGAKGTMTPNNWLQRTAAPPPPLNRNVSLSDSGHSRPAGRGCELTLAHFQGGGSGHHVDGWDADAPRTVRVMPSMTHGVQELTSLPTQRHSTPAKAGIARIDGA